MIELEHYLRPRPSVPVRAWALAVLLLAGAVALALASVAESDQLTVLQRSNDAMRAAQAVKPVVKAKPAELEQQKRWAELLQERDYPWSRVFAAVERADQAGIELLEFKPDKRNHRIVLRGEARDAESLTAYLEALQGDPTLTRVFLAHRQVAMHGPLSTLSFEIKASLVE